MKNRKLRHGLWIICSFGLLAGCGDNFTAGVSLGGSGSGANKPDQNGGPNLGNAGGDKDDQSIVLRFEVPKSIVDSCGGLERELRINHKDDDQLLLSGDTSDQAASQLVITLYNNTAKPIFERVPNCLPLSVMYKSHQDALSEVNINLEHHLSCPMQQSVGVWQPFEKREYRTSLAFIQQIGIYTVNYQNLIAEHWEVEDSKWTKCPDLPITLDVKSAPQKSDKDPDDQSTDQPKEGSFSITIQQDE